MKSRRRLIWLLPVFLLLGLAIPAKYWLEEWGRQRLIAEVKEACPDCDFSLARMRFELWPFAQVRFDEIKLTRGSPQCQQTRTHVAALAVNPAWLGLINQEFKIDRIQVYEPEVVYTDAARCSKPANSSNKSLQFYIHEISVVDGRFIYVRNFKGTHAVLTVEDIDAVVDAIGNSEAWREKPVKAEVQARIGPKGGVEATLVTRPFAGKLNAVIDLRVKNQDLGELGKFFKPNAGVEMSGILVKGRAHSELAGDVAKSAVLAEYENFDIKLNKLYDRSEAQAFFMNLGVALRVSSQNRDKPRWEQIRTVEIRREAGESIASFWLRGLKEASLAIAKGVAAP